MEDKYVFRAADEEADKAKAQVKDPIRDAEDSEKFVMDSLLRR